MVMSLLLAAVILPKGDVAPAMRVAARMVEEKVEVEGRGREIVFEVRSKKEEGRSVDEDGYEVTRKGTRYVVRAGRPRAFLYAAYEPQRWLGIKDGACFRRAPKIGTRMINFNGSNKDVAEWIAATGANAVQLGRSANAKAVARCLEMDVEAWGFIYGCDPSKWGEGGVCNGTNPPRTWEKGRMCPSNPSTWAYFGKKIADVASRAPYTGIVVTFWDDYGLNCVCDTCAKRGFKGNFAAQLAACIACYEKALKPLGKKLIVRTWSSGAPHFLGEEWVHAPGYGGAGGEPLALWGEALKSGRGETIYQTKVYNCDCQPESPFSLLLGHCAGHTEIAEWQITGQTEGRHYLPASVVEHTQRTMRRAAGLIGNAGGVMLYAGGYRRADGYDPLEDKVNALNYHVWRQLSWDPEDDLETICREWSEPIYGEESAAALRAIRASERAAVVAFSPLGLGGSTESGYPKTVERREDLLRYTNRHYLPEGQAALKPTKENIARVVGEKDKAIADLDAAVKDLKDGELKERMGLLRNQLIIARALDGALWRCRYLRAQALVGLFDMPVYRDLERDVHFVEHFKGARVKELGSPIALARGCRDVAKRCGERIVGPIL